MSEKDYLTYSPTPNPPKLSPRPIFPLLFISNTARFLAGWIYVLTTIWSLWIILPFELILSPIMRKLKIPSVYHPADFGMYVWTQLFLFIIGVKVVVEGKGKDPTILVSNHLSALDSFIITGNNVGVSPRYIMKKEMLYFCPPIFVLAKLFGSTTIDRSNTTDSITRLNQAGSRIIKSQRSLIVFPEGTRTRNSKMGAFKKGAFHIAVETKATVTPMVLNGCWHLWPPGHIIPAPGTVKLVYLNEISSENKTPDQLLFESRKAIVDYMENDKFSVHDSGYLLGTLPSVFFLILFYFIMAAIF